MSFGEGHSPLQPASKGGAASALHSLLSDFSGDMLLIKDGMNAHEERNTNKEHLKDIVVVI